MEMALQEKDRQTDRQTERLLGTDHDTAPTPILSLSLSLCLCLSLARSHTHSPTYELIVRHLRAVLVLGEPVDIAAHRGQAHVD
jgi:hypothetical protein